MKKSNPVGQAQHQVDAIQQEAHRLAEQATSQLAEYVRSIEQNSTVKQSQVAMQNGYDQMQQATTQASEQAAHSMANGLEQAATRLRTIKSSNPAAPIAQQVAGMFEQGSEQLQPWSTRSMMRRMARTLRNYPIPTVIGLLSFAGIWHFANRSKQPTN
jgi:flagellar motor protein MotB